jgi:uncharacterized protein YndB with AHSA1/START domain
MTNDMATIDGLTIRFERRLAAPVSRVWRAVTDEDEMRSWFPSAVQGERKVGAPLAFPFDDNVADTFEGEVTEWEPERVFAFTWNGDRLRIELEPDGDATRLLFVQTLSHLTEAARTSSGWHFCLANLDAHLGGVAPDPDAWKGLYSEYLDVMGPPMAEPSAQWSLTWERMHHVSPERVWECLTDPKELEAWMGYRVTRDLRLGGEIAFHFADEDVVRGVIVDLEEGRRIAFTFGGPTVVEWRVEAAEHGSRYRLTQYGMPEARAAGWGAGWHSFLLQLDMYMAAGQLVVDEHEPRIPAYEKLLAVS